MPSSMIKFKNKNACTSLIISKSELQQTNLFKPDLCTTLKVISIRFIKQSNPLTSIFSIRMEIINRPGATPQFSDIEVISLVLAAEYMSLDSENWLFNKIKSDDKKDFANLIYRSGYNREKRQLFPIPEKTRQQPAVWLPGIRRLFHCRFHALRGMQNFQRKTSKNL